MEYLHMGQLLILFNTPSLQPWLYLIHFCNLYLLEGISKERITHALTSYLFFFSQDKSKDTTREEQSSRYIRL